jgi:hypothetical protein
MRRSIKVVVFVAVCFMIPLSTMGIKATPTGAERQAYIAAKEDLAIRQLEIAREQMNPETTFERKLELADELDEIYVENKKAHQDWFDKLNAKDDDDDTPTSSVSSKKEDNNKAAVKAARREMLLNLIGLEKRSKTQRNPYTGQVEKRKNWIANPPNPREKIHTSHKVVAWIGVVVWIIVWCCITGIIITLWLGSGTIAGVVSTWVGSPIAGIVMSLFIWFVVGVYIVTSLAMVFA